VAATAECTPGPIDRCRNLNDAGAMTRSPMPLADDAPVLLRAALRFRDGASLEEMTSSLADLEEALREVSSATQDAADSLIPRARIDESAAQRYARAAAAWPRLGKGAPPTHERQAELLTAFDDARAALRAAAGRCRRARELLTSTIRASGGDLPDLHA
jgi:hypothetical protein